ncbi:hypothetical protein POL68_32570 [Stigmatella sp. ncwal1]|uniref:Uncharacterized protein n=1 Tax=Stigmatella ashevillensis TaxID=2995309 RepID=A0ABT5DHW6_9BACT|nr:hypothetical protein [Stigmatella ashevillena]MDC0713242.1 hypothetical protein [Stigmatella ashevillena]
MKDYGTQFLESPEYFIGGRPIGLGNVSGSDGREPEQEIKDLAGRNSATYLFTLTEEDAVTKTTTSEDRTIYIRDRDTQKVIRTETVKGQKLTKTYPADSIPTLRAWPLDKKLPKRQGILGMWCAASDGGVEPNDMPYCDFPITPALNEPHFVFTVGMNGCSIIIARQVPLGVPPLQVGHWRMFHDHSHFKLHKWHGANYVIQFAAYPNANPLQEAGMRPATWNLAKERIVSYNPHDYSWGVDGSIRGVTNFLYYSRNRNQWLFLSRHFTVGKDSLGNQKLGEEMRKIGPNTTSTQIHSLS